MTSIHHVHSMTLDLPPSCIEFWPLNPQYAVVGTYNLEKPENSAESTTPAGESEEKIKQQRNGSLILLEVVGDEIKIIDTCPTPSAILDLHFNPGYHLPSLFAVATSTGSIDLYNLTNEGQATIEQPITEGVIPKITHVVTYQYFPEDVLVTAFSWHPKEPLFGMALSSGEIRLGSTFNPKTTVPVCAHDLEAWTLAFFPSGLGVYSGGDDSKLIFTELPKKLLSKFSVEDEADFEEPRRMPWSDKKIHGAGVTAILPIEDLAENLVITGSYDDHIRLIEAPAGGRRKVLAEMNLGGGVWRLKRLDQSRESVLLLVSCMHAGSRIMRMSRRRDGEWQFEVLGQFTDHKSMNYGSDSQPGVGDDGRRTFVTTSFYDRRLCLWRF